MRQYALEKLGESGEADDVRADTAIITRAMAQRLDSSGPRLLRAT